MSEKGEESDYLFAFPVIEGEVSNLAKTAIAMGAIAGRLVQEERTLTQHPDGRNENVAEHSFMLAKVAVELARRMYPGILDPGRVALAAICHDDLEAYVGDTPTHNIDQNGLAEKYRREAVGLARLAIDYEDVAPGYVSDMLAYEAQEDLNVRFVRVVDKLMVLLIHIPNNGEVLVQHFPEEVLVKHRNNVRKRMLQEYPEFADVIQLDEEITNLLIKRYLASNT